VRTGKEAAATFPDRGGMEVKVKKPSIKHPTLTE